MILDKQKSPRSYGYIDMRKKSLIFDSYADMHTWLPILFKSLKDYAH